MRRPSRRIAPYLALVAGCAVQLLGASPQASNAAASQASTHRTVLNKYCVSCHNDRLRTAGLTLEKADIANLAGEAALWEKVLEKARNASMPPPGLPRPDQATYAALAGYLETSLDRAAEAKAA